MSVNEELEPWLGRGPNSVEFGSLLRRRRLAKLSAKELQYRSKSHTGQFCQSSQDKTLLQHNGIRTNKPYTRSVAALYSEGPIVQQPESPTPINKQQVVNT